MPPPPMLAKLTCSVRSSQSASPPSLAARRSSSLQSARLKMSPQLLSAKALASAQARGRAYGQAPVARPSEDVDSYFPQPLATPGNSASSNPSPSERSAGSPFSPQWHELLPKPLQAHAVRAQSWAHSQWIAANDFLAQPEGKRLEAALWRAARSTGAVLIGAGLGALCGGTGALVRTFGGSQQIAEICRALPYIGGILHALIGASGTYGAGALIGVLMAFSSSVFEVGDDGHGATPEQRDRAWRSLHGSLAMALSPLFVAGAGVSPALLLAAAVGTAFVSWYADESLRRSAPGGFESALMAVSIALGLSTVGASLAQHQRAAAALNGAFAWPCVMGAAIVTTKVGKALWELLPRGREQSSVLQRIDTRKTFFDVDDLADPVRRDSSNVLVPLIGTDQDEVLSWVTFWRDAVRQRTEHGPQVLWLNGPRKSGKRKATEALAHALGVEMSEIDVTAVPTAEQENQLRQGLNDAAELARKDRRHRLLYLPHFDALIPAPPNAAGADETGKPRANAENPLRGVLLFALENNARVSQADLIIVASTRQPSGIDEGLNSRLGAVLELQPVSDWAALLGRSLHKEIKERAWSQWQTWWPELEDLSAFDGAFDEVVKRARAEGWVAGDGHEVAETAARGICVAFNLFERRHGKQQAASRFDFAGNARHCLQVAAERHAQSRLAVAASPTEIGQAEPVAAVRSA